jgi:hypothetical protein
MAAVGERKKGEGGNGVRIVVGVIMEKKRKEKKNK